MNSSEAADRICAALAPVPGVDSVTLVGSFVDRGGVANCSDIDTVVVFDRLTPDRFAAAVAAVERLPAAALGFPDKRVRINATFGPLKFDTGDQVVIHLMLYDAASHRDHALKSPFTCLDWERSGVCHGTPLAQIYPVGRLQPADFFNARRSLSDYAADLESGALSFRRLEPAADRMIEVADRVELDSRHRGEYAYHVIRNLVVNLLKMLSGENRAWSENALRCDWTRALPDLVPWIPLYERLRELKIARSATFPVDCVRQTRAFIEACTRSIEERTHTAPLVRFVRHGRTPLNDGTFLGRGRDPSLAESLASAGGERWDSVYSSPLRRAVETARAMAPGLSPQVDHRLTEIDYGDAEGLTPVDARARFPELARAWDAGEDPAFPRGESTQEVLDRLQGFLDETARKSSPGHRSLVVTHNVVMRVVAATLLGLDSRRAYRIPIGHLDALDARLIDDRWVPSFAPAIKRQILDGYVGWPGD